MNYKQYVFGHFEANYKDNSTDFLEEKCRDTSDAELCIQKSYDAYNYVYNVLSDQLIRERKLNDKYDRMYSFKKLRGDKDAFKW